MSCISIVPGASGRYMTKRTRTPSGAKNAYRGRERLSTHHIQKFMPKKVLDMMTSSETKCRCPTEPRSPPPSGVGPAFVQLDLRTLASRRLSATATTAASGRNARTAKRGRERSARPLWSWKDEVLYYYTLPPLSQ